MCFRDAIGVLIIKHSLSITYVYDSIYLTHAWPVLKCIEFFLTCKKKNNNNTKISEPLKVNDVTHSKNVLYNLNPQQMSSMYYMAHNKIVASFGDQRKTMLGHNNSKKGKETGPGP